MAETSFETLIISQLAAIKDDVNRASARYDASLSQFFELHRAYVTETNGRLEELDKRITASSIEAAEVKGRTIASAKMWAFIASLPVPVAALILGIWRATHKLP